MAVGVVDRKELPPFPSSRTIHSLPPPSQSVTLQKINEALRYTVSLPDAQLKPNALSGQHFVTSYVRDGAPVALQSLVFSPDGQIPRLSAVEKESESLYDSRRAVGCRRGSRCLQCAGHDGHHCRIRRSEFISHPSTLVKLDKGQRIPIGRHKTQYDPQLCAHTSYANVSAACHPERTLLHRQLPPVRASGSPAVFLPK